MHGDLSKVGAREEPKHLDLEIQKPWNLGISNGMAYGHMTGCYDRRVFISFRSSPYGSFTTLGSLLRIMVARFVVSNAGHAGRPLWLGLPVRAKLLQAMLILS